MSFQEKLKWLKPSSATTYVLSLVGFYLVLSNVQRLVYVAWISSLDHGVPPRLPIAFGKGILFDLAAAFYMFLPLILVLMLMPRRWLAARAGRVLIHVLTLIPLYLAFCSAICELFFFQEFHARFNFIAVDYLVYTNEVIRNIFESYPMVVVIGTFTLPLILLIYTLRRRIAHLDFSTRQMFPWRFRITGVIALALIAALTHEDRMLGNEPYWPREVAKSSLFALFSAYNRNSINFTEFYTSLDPKVAEELTQKWLGGPLAREIHNGPEKKWNVVLVAMESMSASFLSHFGNQKIITANLDRLADEGLLFTNLYASGTRTVRGLEALMLSLPPTPGQSILRRPDSDGLFNLGSVFAQHGYKTQFIYGGFALFDNMKEWFQSNGFEVVDRAKFPREEIHFANAWGVCDEDLFSQVLKQEQTLAEANTPFFQVVLTTSNHRPYTFPEGKIDIPSHTGREGAIKYSDFAIGRFIEEAKTKPWFDNTLFIFVADHDASVAGGTDIPVRDYLIPAIFYGPKIMPPQKIDKLAAQIDLAPTLLGFLGFSYRSKFFGQDLTQSPGGRALLGTYQKVALLEPGHLTVLAPGHTVETQELNSKYEMVKSSSVFSRDASGLSESARTTIAIYQTASELFRQGRLKLADDSDKPAP